MLDRDKVPVDHVRPGRRWKVDTHGVAYPTDGKGLTAAVYTLHAVTCPHRA